MIIAFILTITCSVILDALLLYGLLANKKLEYSRKTNDFLYYLRTPTGICFSNQEESMLRFIITDYKNEIIDILKMDDVGKRPMG